LIDTVKPSETTADEQLSGDHDPATERVASLDLVRGIAALCVALPHFFAYRGIFREKAETVAVLAVEVFFVLSGYVLAPQILFCLKSNRLRHLRTFVVRRWMRTIPPYLVALLLISVVTGQIGTSNFVHYLLYVQNLVRQDNTSDYFPIAWSLSVEEWFYVTFPVLLIAAAFAVDRRNMRFALTFAIVFCVSVAAARLAFGDLHDWGSAVRRVVVFRIDSIGYGFLLYLGIEGFKRPWLRNIPIWILAVAAVVMTAFSIAILDHIAATGDPLAEQIFPFAAALFGSALILFALRCETLLWRRPRVAQLGFWLGRISYSTYLFHIILIELIVAAFPRVGIMPEGLLFVAVLFTLTTAFYASFERPILARRPRYTARQRVSPGLGPSSPG